MHICFIEDTPLHGGTQIWVAEAIHYALTQGERVTLLAPENSWIGKQMLETDAQIKSYDWDGVAQQSTQQKEIWFDALKNCDVALCTVHPPRDDFHCVSFAAQVIHDGNLQTILIPKTGTIVPEYKREYYQPNEIIRSAVIAIAKFTQRYLIDNYDISPEKVILIYQGVDIRRFHSSPAMQAEAQNCYPLPAQANPILGCVGSFEERKGQTILLKALSLAKIALPDIHLMLVGDGADEEKLRRLVKKMDLERHISFFPFTTQPETVFERVDMTILPSIAKEGLPNVLLESMSMGTPVIASDLGGIPEVIIDGETGILVSPRDINQLRDAILHLWKVTALRQEISRNALHFVQSNFDKQRQFAHFFAFFDQVITKL
jgi:glycosyltransferase involved in cell wall biosynthesis